MKDFRKLLMVGPFLLLSLKTDTSCFYTFIENKQTNKTFYGHATLKKWLFKREFDTASLSFILTLKEVTFKTNSYPD